MTELAPEVFQYFSRLIEEETGILYDVDNAYLLKNRLTDLAQGLGMQQVSELWRDVQSNGLSLAAKTMLFDLATNNETSFFRDRPFFDYFRRQVLERSHCAQRPLRIWCAAVSTGQEAYSLSMVLAELRAQGTHQSYEILATDISPRVLKQASTGIYSQFEVQRGLPQGYAERYFRQEHSESSSLPVYRILPDLRTAITFQRLNLLETWPNLGLFDIVLCRNVLIYQSPDNKRRTIARLAQQMTANAYLVLGDAESLAWLSESFNLEQQDGARIYRLKGPQLLR